MAAELFGFLLRYVNSNGDARVPAQYALDGHQLGSWVGTQRAFWKAGRLSAERQTRLRAVHGWSWDPFEEDWQTGIAAARDYWNANRHLRVTRGFVTSDGFQLGAWIVHRRILRRTGKLAANRIAELEALDMVWDPFEEDWQTGIAAARDYWNANGHLRVPREFVTDDGFKLGTWINSRRAEQRSGRLAANRIAELEALDAVWDGRDEAWQRGITAALDYCNANGHLRIPYEFIASDSHRLGIWISERRADRRQDRLAVDRIAALDALGMIWNPIEDDWQRGIAAARAFHAEHGHLRAPRSLARGGVPLGVWLQTRRQDMRRGELPPWRVAELNAMGMVWDPHDDAWQRGIAAARAYREENGHLRIPQNYVTTDGFSLGRWITRCRAAQRSDKLAANRIAELETLGMVWQIAADGWERGVETAREYRTQHGHLRVPNLYTTPDGFGLGRWIDYRRQLHKKGELSLQRIAQLEALGMVWDARAKT